MRELTKEEREFLEELLERTPTQHQGYWRYRITKDGRNCSYKRARVLMQLYLGKTLETWELVHHKDQNRENDEISNLEVLNASQITNGNGKKPKGWKPANTLESEIVDKIKQIASEMVKINYSEISRRLEKEGIKVTSATIGRYLSNK